MEQKERPRYTYSLMALVLLFFLELLLAWIVRECPCISENEKAKTLQGTKIEVNANSRTDNDTFMQQMMAAQDMEYNIRCQDWADDYKDFHQKALESLHSNPGQVVHASGIKILVFRPSYKFHQGYADRIAGLQKAFLLAFCSRRLFFVDWPAIQELFQDGDIVWKYPHNLFASLKESYTIEDIVHEIDETSMEDYIDLLSTPDSRPLISIHFNRAASIETLQTTQCGNRLRSLGLSENNLFGCIMRLLLVPKMEVLLPHVAIARTIQNNSQQSIGVQLRFGDDVLGSTRQTSSADIEGMIQHILRRAECLKPYLGDDQLSLDRFFLLTDDVEFKKKAIELYPSRVYATSISPKHVGYSTSHDEYAEVVAEWFLFSLTRFHVIDGGSGIGRTSYTYSLSRYPSFYSRFELECVPRWPKDLADKYAMLR